jgi:hypothetical protein
MTRIAGTLHKDVGTFFPSRSLLLKMINVSDGSCGENRKSKHTLYVQQLFFLIFRKSCCVWDSVEKYGRAIQATDCIIRRMRFTCWITMDTDTISECVLLIVFSRQQCLRERASVLRVYVPLPVLLSILKDYYEYKHSPCRTWKSY